MEKTRSERELDIDPTEVRGEKLQKSEEGLEDERIQEEAVRIANLVIPEIDPELEAGAEIFYYESDAFDRPWHRVRFKQNKLGIEWINTFKKADLNKNRVKEIIQSSYNNITGSSTPM